MSEDGRDLKENQVEEVTEARNTLARHTGM